MSATCEPAAEQVTRELGFDCHDVSPVVSVHNPFDLASWTMPVLELLIIGGAVFALVHAVRRYRGGDPINLALWFAPLVYLFVTEPPLYFPEWFGLDQQYGFIFAHNIFTVQFMWDRLPLYIIAIYPAMTALAYELVRVLGIFRNRGPSVGSVAVAFVCHVFYEIFDHLGPQLKWWAWNDDNVQVNHPALASVPMNSMVLFASVSFGVMTYLVVQAAVKPEIARLVADLAHRRGRRPEPAGDGCGRDPVELLRRRDSRPDRAGLGPGDRARPALAGRRLGAHHPPPPARCDEVEPMTPFARIYPAAYLAVMALCWAVAVTADRVHRSAACSTRWPALARRRRILAVLHSGRRRARRGADGG